MSQLVVLILNDPDDCHPILETWEKAGITGVTILHSTGLGRMRRAALRDDLPLMPSISDIFNSKEEFHRTLLSVVENQEDVDKMIEGVESVIGNLDDPHTGFLFVVPVVQVHGFNRNAG